MRYVIDTHAFLWHMTDDKRLGSNARSILDLIDQNKAKAFIPSIVLAEAIFIIEKKKIKGISYKDITIKIHNSVNYIIIALDWQILEKISVKVDIPEIHDRIIVVTAEIFDAKIISKDDIIKRVYSETIW